MLRPVRIVWLKLMILAIDAMVTPLPTVPTVDQDTLLLKACRTIEYRPVCLILLCVRLV